MLVNLKLSVMSDGTTCIVEATGVLGNCLPSLTLVFIQFITYVEYLEVNNHLTLRLKL